MHECINAEDTKLWDVILDGPYIPLEEVKVRDLTTTVVNIERNRVKLTGKRLKRTTRRKRFKYVVLVLTITIEFRS